MGICCSKKSDKEANIRYQIEQTVIEQQKLRDVEQEIQLVHGIRDTSSKRSVINTNGLQHTTMNTHQGRQEELENENLKDDEKQFEEVKIEEKQTKTKKGKVSKDDTNYFKRTEHILHVKAIIVELHKDEVSQYYNLTIRVDLKDYLCDAKLNGVLVTQHDHFYFDLKPNTFSEANKYSRFLTFFSSDNYFNANKESINNSNAFDKLLRVERTLKMKPIEQKLRKRQTFTDSPIKQKQEKQFLVSNQPGMMEIITVIDIEQQSRFLGILFHLLLQQHHPELENYLVFIQDATFLFETPPSFDQPNIHKVALFYDQLDYSLKDLQSLLTKEKIEISSQLHKLLSLNLAKILYNCYSKYLYRLNFTLSTIFYVAKFKVFKLESFGRAKSLLPFHHDQEKMLKTIDDKKYQVYNKAFRRDLGAICDLIVYFKHTKDTSLRSIQTKRRKFLKNQKQGNEEDNEKDGNYLRIAEQLFNQEDERYILELVKLVLYTNQMENTQINLKSILDIIESLQKQIDKHDRKYDLENKEQEDVRDLNQLDLDDSGQSLNEPNDLKSFDIDFADKYSSLVKNKEKISELELSYKEVIYQSLLYKDTYFNVSKRVNQTALSKLQQAQLVVMNSFYQIKQMKDDSWQVKIQQMSQYIEETIQIINSINDDSIDHFHISILFQILSLSLRKPLVLVNQLQRCLTKQLQEKMKIEHKLRGQNSAKGLIEQKKHVIVQTMYAQSYLQSDHYFQAIAKIQQVIGFQLKSQHVASLSYGYSLLISGEISRISLQPVSAMLNLEMSLAIYNQFFPEQIEVEIIPEEPLKNKNENEVKKESQEEEKIKTQFQKVNNLATGNMAKVELLLGLSYFDSHDQDNSLKSLKRAQQLMQRQFGMFTDEVVTLVLQQLHIHVLQDDVGQVMRIAMQYAQAMDLYYREGKDFKRRCVSKLQFILGCIFEFSGSFLTSLRYIERSNRTLSNSRKNNFLIQAYYYQKKVKLIQKVKRAFLRIKNRQTIRETLDLKQFQTLSDAIGQAFQNQYYFQPANHKASLLFNRYSKQLMKIQGLIRVDEKQKAIAHITKVLQVLSKSKKDEVYSNLKDKLITVQISVSQSQNQIVELQRLIEIHERYLQFPQKQYYKLKAQLLLLFLCTKLGDSKQLNFEFSRTDDLIQEIYGLLNWQVQIPQDQQQQKKFEKIKKQGGFTILYQIQLIVDLIHLFYSSRKKIFDIIQNKQQLKELGSQLITRLLSQKSKAIFMKKLECLQGIQAQVKIIAESAGNPQSNQDPEKKGLFRSQESIILKESPTTQAPPSKLVFDLRSYEEIINEKQVHHHHPHHQKQASQEVVIENPVREEKIMKKHKRTGTEMTAASLNKKNQSSKFKINPFESTIKRTKK